MQNKSSIIGLVITIAVILFGIIVGIGANALINSKNNNGNYLFIDDVWQEITNDSEDDLNFEDENSLLGTLEIPRIELSAPIKEGTNKSVIDKYVGHFTNSDIWEGNVALASHNRGENVSTYFSRINELQKDDEIIYKTKLGERKYKVTETKEIDDNDWSVIESNEEKNKITLVTCVANESSKRYCVIGEEN